MISVAIHREQAHRPASAARASSTLLSVRIFSAAVLFAALVTGLLGASGTSPARAQSGTSFARAQSGAGQAGARSASDPAATLADALIAACRQDPAEFAKHLTAENAEAFRALPQSQRTALLKRFVLLDEPGRPLLSADADGHTRVRCDAGGVISELRFGATQLRDNLAFIPLEVPEAGTPTGEKMKAVRFGLVRESGEWKLLSLGLLLLDIPALAQGWEGAELEARESAAIISLQAIAAALKAYQQAYGKLPEALEQLGHSATPGASPENAGLLDQELASGESGGYRFRYSIAAAADEADESERDKSAGFALAATPVIYGKDGRRSFYLDSRGQLRGGDKQGAVANTTDPRISAPAAPEQP